MYKQLAISSRDQIQLYWTILVDPKQIRSNHDCYTYCIAMMTTNTEAFRHQLAATYRNNPSNLESPITHIQSLVPGLVETLEIKIDILIDPKTSKHSIPTKTLSELTGLFRPEKETKVIIAFTSSPEVGEHHCIGFMTNRHEINMCDTSHPTPISRWNRRTLNLELIKLINLYLEFKLYSKVLIFNYSSK